MKKHLLSIRKKGLSILLSSVITVSCTVPLCTTAYAEENDYQLANNIQDGTILHCFDWKYSDIMRISQEPVLLQYRSPLLKKT